MGVKARSSEATAYFDGRSKTSRAHRFRLRGSTSILDRHLFYFRRTAMGKYFIGWLLGVPVVVLVIIYLLMN